MTDERMALIELIEKQADTDLVGEMLAFAADRIGRSGFGPNTHMQLGRSKLS